jgi:transposase
MSSFSPPWRDREKMKDLYVEKDLSQYEIADRFGCTQANVSKWVKRHDLEKEHPWHDEEKMRQLYVEEDLTCKEVAERVGCVVGTAEKWLSIHTIYDTDDSSAPEELTDEEWLRDRYQSKSSVEIADELGCSYPTVSKYLNRHGIDTRMGPPPTEPLNDAQVLREWYLGDDMSSKEIAEKVGCSPDAVRNWLRRHGIPLRPPAHEQDPPIGPDHPRWNGGNREYGSEWYLSRKERLAFDDYECVVCGMSQESHIQEYGQELHVHHIIKKEEFRDEDGELDEERAHDLENLITLCQNDHAKWEGVPLRPQ